MRRCTWGKRHRADGMADDFEARLTVWLPAHVFFVWSISVVARARNHVPANRPLEFRFELAV